MSLWLVRSKGRIYFTANSEEGAIRWAATHMGFPNRHPEPGSFPECIFEFQTVRVTPGYPGEQVQFHTAYVDWELDDNENASTFHLTIKSSEHTVLDVDHPIGSFTTVLDEDFTLT